MDELPLNTPVTPSSDAPGFGNFIKDIMDRTTPAPAAKPAADPAPPAAPKAPPSLDMPAPKAQDPAPPAKDTPDTIKSTKAADDFRKIRAERDAKARELEELRKTIDPELQEKLKRAETEREELSSRLRLLDLERHPEFIKKYDEKISTVETSVKSLVGTDGEKLVSLLKAPRSEYRDSQIDEIVESLTPAKKATLGSWLVRYEEIHSEKAAEVDQARKNYAEVASRYKTREAEGVKEAVNRSSQVWSKVVDSAKELEVFVPKEGDEAWNTELTQRQELAKQIFSGQNSEEDLAKAALWAAAAPKYRELLYAQIELNRRLQDQLSKLSSSSPTVDNRGTASKSMSGPKSEDFIAGVMKSLGR